MERNLRSNVSPLEYCRSPLEYCRNVPKVDKLMRIFQKVRNKDLVKNLAAKSFDKSNARILVMIFVWLNIGNRILGLRRHSNRIRQEDAKQINLFINQL